MPRQIVRLAANVPVEEMVAALHADGVVIIEGLLDPELLDRFNAELDPLLAAAPAEQPYLNPALPFFFGAQTRHVTAVPAKSRIFSEEVLVTPQLLSICDAILGPSCARYQLNLAHVLDRGPGSDQQIMHRDELVWNFLPKPHPEVQVAAIIALCDFTAENGATRVVPGSHRDDREMVLDPAEIERIAVPAEMSAGSAVVYLGSTLHGGGANTTTDRRRRGMHMSYVLGWLRTEENNYLSLWPDVITTLPRQSQELLGFAAHDAVMQGGGYLGVYELQDPVEVFSTTRI
jgi:ectoine hydroxylase-related dioxygenase (phytanoyl-CoA dioxygenase family)